MQRWLLPTAISQLLPGGFTPLLAQNNHQYYQAFICVIFRDNMIDENMEYKPKILVPNIDNHVFSNEDGIDDDGDDNEEQEMTMEISGVMTRLMILA